MSSKESFRLDEIVNDTIRLSRSVLKDHSYPAIVFNGSKDSTLILWFFYKKIKRRIPVIFINTRLLFEETMNFVEDLRRKWDLNLHRYRPQSEPNLTDRRRCCLERRGEPLKRACQELNIDLLIEGSRGDERCPIPEYFDLEESIVRFYPLKYVKWDDIWKIIFTRNIPHHPFYDIRRKYFLSLGCQSCIKPTGVGMSEMNARVQDLMIIKRLSALGYY